VIALLCLIETEKLEQLTINIFTCTTGYNLLILFQFLFYLSFQWESESGTLCSVLNSMGAVHSEGAEMLNGFIQLPVILCCVGYW